MRYSLSGPALMVGTVAACTILKIIASSHCKDEQLTIDRVVEVAEETRPIKRNESEFSLGLNRSESFENLATSLGPLCSTGQGVWFICELGFKIFVVVMVGKVMIEMSTPPPPPIHLK